MRQLEKFEVFNGENETEQQITWCEIENDCLIFLSHLIPKGWGVNTQRNIWLAYVIVLTKKTQSDFLLRLRKTKVIFK